MDTAIIEWGTVRSRFDRALLNAAGVPRPSEWIVHGKMNQAYTACHLSARPHFVARHRPAEVCIGRLIGTPTPESLPRWIAVQGTLDAAVVCASLRSEGLDMQEVRVLWLFEDGGRFESRQSAGDLEQILRKAEELAAATAHVHCDTGAVARDLAAAGGAFDVRFARQAVHPEEHAAR